MKGDKLKIIRHGLDGVSAYCRECSFGGEDKGIDRRAKEHCKETKHTVDIYREHWTELTFYQNSAHKK